MTAEDVAYTWATNIKYETTAGVGYRDYIAAVEAVDAETVVVKAALNESGKAVNPLQVMAYISSEYVVQKAWTQTLEARTGEDATAFKADPAEDFVASGPYTKFFADDTKVVYVRDDNYWGQDASMWGALPAPKYLCHAIYADNNAGFLALKAGEVDVSQQFNANVQDLWLVDNLPISTYMPEAPYGVTASLPTAYFNLNSFGLDNVAVRKAIAMAVDYDTIIANAMTNQSPTFTQVPRSIMNPTTGEQALYDHDAVADLQWAGNDIEGANALLDEAGIVRLMAMAGAISTGRNCPTMRFAPTVGRTGRLPSRSSLPPDKISVLRSPPCSPNGAFTRLSSSTASRLSTTSSWCGATALAQPILGAVLAS